MSTESYSVITSPVVNVTVTSNISSFRSERRFDKSLRIAELKGKLELLTGAATGTMKLELYDKYDKLVTKLNVDDSMLGSFPVDDGMRLHVIDESHSVGEFEDLSQVKKFEMADDDYAKRGDSVRSFLARNKMGKYSDGSAQDAADKEQQLKVQEKEEESLASSIEVNARCEVRVPGQTVRRGTVMFVGKVHFKPGWWIGVKYDEPFGKNDGSVDKQRYFECQPKYGGFVKPLNITVGDFPEEDYGLDEEM